MKRYAIVSSAIILFMFTACSHKNGTNPETAIQPFIFGDRPMDGVIGLIEDYEMDEPTSGTIYIDPENTDSNQDGSIQHPYSTYGQVTQEPYLTVAFKRGTVYETSEQILLGHHGMVLMSYGESSVRPIIRSAAETHAIVGHWQGVQEIVIRDLEIESLGGTASITFNPTDGGNEYISVINCKLHGGGWGLRAMGIIGLFVENTEVYDTLDDGIFVRWNNDVEVFNCYIHNVNKNWQPPHTPETEAGGDALQLDDSDHWHVHHNIFDRSSSGNKFAFIANNDDQRNGIFEFNKLIGPQVDGNSIYIGAGSGLIFRYNTITDCPGNPLYSHASELKVYGNVFARLGGPIYISGSGHIFRNTFHDIHRIADGNKLTIECNIFSFTSSDQKDYSVPKFTEMNNLYYGTDRIRSNSFAGNPDFVDVENDDFHLGDNSDAVDHGTATEMLVDMDGTKIPQGYAPDVGAYERATSSTLVQERH